MTKLSKPETERTDLSVKMHALADGGHAMADELRAKARAFDEATAGNFCTPPTHTVKQLLGSWARATRCWSNAT